MRTVRVIVGAALTLALLPPVLAAHGTERAAGVNAVLVEGGLQKPTGFTFDPRGRIWYIEKDSGEIRILSPGSGADRLFFDVPDACYALWHCLPGVGPPAKRASRMRRLTRAAARPSERQEEGAFSP